MYLSLSLYLSLSSSNAIFWHITVLYQNEKYWPHAVFWQHILDLGYFMFSKVNILGKINIFRTCFVLQKWIWSSSLKKTRNVQTRQYEFVEMHQHICTLTRTSPISKAVQVFTLIVVFGPCRWEGTISKNVYTIQHSWSYPDLCAKHWGSYQLWLLSLGPVWPWGGEGTISKNVYAIQHSWSYPDF